MDNAIRSLRRWVAAVLQEPWTIAVQEQPTAVPDDQRPTGHVLPLTDEEVLFARRSIPQGDIRKGQTFVVTLFPAVGDTPRTAAAESRRVAVLVEDSLVLGTLQEADDSLFSYPMTIPFWDYRDVPVTGVDRAGPEDSVTSMEVEGNPSVRDLADPEDPRRRTVAMTVRLTWWEGGRAPEAGPLVTGMPTADPVLRYP